MSVDAAARGRGSQKGPDPAPGFLLRDLVVCHLDSENGPERVVWAAAPEWIIEDLPNVGIRPDRYYRPVPLPGTTTCPTPGR